MFRKKATHPVELAKPDKASPKIGPGIGTNNNMPLLGLGPLLPKNTNFTCNLKEKASTCFKGWVKVDSSGRRGEVHLQMFKKGCRARREFNSH